jgi:hypothetical protein
MAAKARYENLAGKHRMQFLQRARHNALLTIPSIMPLEGHTGTSHLVEPYQGLGADGSTHLSSRLTMAMMPAGRPYMRFDLDPKARMQNNGETDPDVEKGMALSELLVQSKVEKSAWRTSMLQQMLQLVICGNVGEYLRPDGTIRVYRLDQYVVRRDHAGKLLEMIIEEKLDRDMVPGGNSVPRLDSLAEDEEVELYTVIKLVVEKGVEFYRVHQEMDDTALENTRQSYDVADLPYFAHRWSTTPGEDYGRSKVEDHIGDLRSLETLEKAMLEMGAMAAKNFIMVKPAATGGGLKNRIAKCLNGDVLVGDPDSVELKSFDNPSGFQITDTQVSRVRESIAKSFLLLSGAQRNAERVTAAEIERDIQELEGALGGIFSTLSLEMLEARTRLLILMMQRNEELPPWPEGMINPTILTGLEALSRERDIGRAMQAGQIAQAFGQEGLDAVKVGPILGRAYIGLGFPDAVRTQDEVRELQQQRAQQEAMQAGMQAAIPEAVKQGGPEQ